MIHDQSGDSASKIWFWQDFALARHFKFAGSGYKMSLFLVLHFFAYCWDLKLMGVFSNYHRNSETNSRNILHRLDFPVRDTKRYEHANNVRVKYLLAWVKFEPNFTLFCRKRELCRNFLLFGGIFWHILKFMLLFGFFGTIWVFWALFCR